LEKRDKMLELAKKLSVMLNISMDYVEEGKIMELSKKVRKVSKNKEIEHTS